MRSWVLVRWCARVLPLLLVAVAAYFQARGATALLRSVVAGAGDMSRSVHALVPPRAAEPKAVRALLANNPFDSSARTLGAPSPTPSAADDSDPLAWPQCEGVQVLIVTESVNDPWWSLTSLRDASEPSARLRRVGDGVAGKQVAFIGYNPRQQAPTVWLQGRSGSCQSMLFQKPVSVADTAASQSTEPASLPGIHRLSDTELRVERAVVETTLADPTSLMRSVRVVPDKQGGQIVGLKLLGIRPGSLLGSVGLESGDRLESINGLSMNSPEKALQAYAQLRTAQRLNVQVSRRGRPVELTLNIN
jgi:general secretion pathway protein C